MTDVESISTQYTTEKRQSPQWIPLASIMLFMASLGLIIAGAAQIDKYKPPHENTS